MKFNNFVHTNVGHGEVCDQTNYDSQSPDWKGPNWYRIEGKAGARIPDALVDYCHCNTDATGWINGTHPATVGESVERTVCFNWQPGTCYHQTDIQIKNCGKYFLYYLEDVPLCKFRYCTQ